MRSHCCRRLSFRLRGEHSSAWSNLVQRQRRGRDRQLGWKLRFWFGIEWRSVGQHRVGRLRLGQLRFGNRWLGQLWLGQLRFGELWFGFKQRLRQFGIERIYGWRRFQRRLWLRFEQRLRLRFEQRLRLRIKRRKFYAGGKPRHGDF